MTLIFKMSEFGTFLGDSTKAISFFRSSVRPAIEKNETIEFDFNGVRSMNSSFSNALFANIYGIYGDAAISKIKYRNCNELTKLLVQSAFQIGLDRYAETHKQKQS
ncbi:STAS-like domain-containing protein [Desulfuromonas thiophila]|uniref:STAS-like domain-containing protein n=1 Tax=Desulfuromonas thiophila TaxID=57664 RepID=UPI0029F46EA7|nr:STAS-like domain-containing protein [Desulfuromonas thiophila]